MHETLGQEIEKISDSSLCVTPEICQRFLARAEDGALTRDEKPTSHFCLYFLPYNPESKKVFIIHHRKSGLWLSPGGHIDQGETIFQTLVREIKEELGFIYSIPENLKPFLLTITPIENEIQPCKIHFDIWYGIQTDGSGFKVDPREFHETRWLTIPEARGLVTDPPNFQALSRIEAIFS